MLNTFFERFVLVCPLYQIFSKAQIAPFPAVISLYLLLFYSIYLKLYVLRPFSVMIVSIRCHNFAHDEYQRFNQSILTISLLNSGSYFAINSSFYSL